AHLGSEDAVDTSRGIRVTRSHEPAPHFLRCSHYSDQGNPLLGSRRRVADVDHHLAGVDATCHAVLSLGAGKSEIHPAATLESDKGTGQGDIPHYALPWNGDIEFGSLKLWRRARNTE